MNLREITTDVGQGDILPFSSLKKAIGNLIGTELEGVSWDIWLWSPIFMP